MSGPARDPRQPLQSAPHFFFSWGRRQVKARTEGEREEKHHFEATTRGKLWESFSRICPLRRKQAQQALIREPRSFNATGECRSCCFIRDSSCARLPSKSLSPSFCTLSFYSGVNLAKVQKYRTHTLKSLETKKRYCTTRTTKNHEKDKKRKTTRQTSRRQPATGKITKEQENKGVGQRRVLLNSRHVT